MSERPVGVRQALIGIVGYMILLPVSLVLVRGGFVTNPILAGLVALLPVLPFLYFIAGVVLGIRAQDELARQINLEAVVITILVVGAATFKYGLLEAAELVPPLSMIWVAPLMVAVWGVATFLVSRRYR